MTAHSAHNSVRDGSCADDRHAAALWERLSAAAPLRAAEPGDEVGGVAPAWVARPTSTQQVADLLAAAHATHAVSDGHPGAAAEPRSEAAALTVVARGIGAHQSFGNPPRRLDLVIETGGLDEIIEYAPHDLVLRVGAGVRLNALAGLLAEQGQRLAVDPPRRGTVAGTLAVGTAGPLRLSHGSPRDLVIGMTFVRADGVVAHSGGKVVKNVAGYDLAKLFAGSYGTLGVITELTFRLHPLPEASAWVGGLVDPAGVGPVISALTHSQSVPAAVEYDVPADGRASLWVQYEGTPVDLEARTAQALAILATDSLATDSLATDSGAQAQVADEAPFWWGDEPPGAALLKVTHVLGRGATLAAGLQIGAQEAGVQAAYRGSPLVGTGLVGVSDVGDGDDVGDSDDGGAAARFAAFVQGARARTAAAGGTLTVLSAPPAWRAAVDVWGPVPGLELMRALKDQFDPRGALAPGRFVGGI
ncbi:glycolate oxidase FAD binding subunit [Kineosphaera limosa]|uniref:Putative FAD-linked oxidase n=1 Tax=Kineosphaera limosa NBRC 100340 TaxID=1184609 RepID=K6W8K3_9MICO|nr:FAD-binding oxidoreductase [Kineosphaera limosa]NYD99933.1 glycolate oxidase FAD binding subunit [Kineosphaera limosa]GAB95530.1 putative FAD-linked oxidase [Kineosphaera limosa NBRC 100340]